MFTKFHLKMHQTIQEMREDDEWLPDTMRKCTTIVKIIDPDHDEINKYLDEIRPRRAKAYWWRAFHTKSYENSKIRTSYFGFFDRHKNEALLFKMRFG